MRYLKASEIIEAMKIFNEKCKKLDNMRDDLLNMYDSLLQRILSRLGDALLMNDIKYAIVTREENNDYDEDFYISNKEDCIKLAEKLLEDVDHYRMEFNYFGIAELIEDEEADFNDDTTKHCTYLILMQEKGYYDKKFWISSKKECHEYIKCLRNKETYFCGYPEKKEYSYLKLAKVIKEAKLKSCLIDV